MAKRYAIASGNWSNAAIWDGGTLPGASDDVYPNSFTVTIDQNVTVLSLTNQANASTPTILANGTFNANNGVTISATAGGFVMNAVAVVNIPGSVSCGLIGNITGVASTGAATITITTTGTVNVAGNINMTGGGNRFGMSIGANAVVNIVGDVLTTGTAGANVVGITVTSNCTLNVMGKVESGASIAIANTAAFNLNVTGPVNATGIANTFSVAQPLTISITGNVSATGGASIMSTASVVTGTIVGSITSGTSVPAIVTTAAGSLWTISGPLVNNNYLVALVAQRIRFMNAVVTSWLFQTDTAANKPLYSAGVALGNPLPANVRSGTLYGSANELAGTLAVPPAAAVSIGVPVDHTTGSAYLSAAEIWNHPLANITTPNSIGQRLKNAATVQSTGDQLAALGN